MRDADETIKRLLTGLRDAEPSAGMQSRILEAMEVHPAVSPKLLESWRVRPSVATLILCAAVLAAALTVTIKIHQPRQESRNTTSHLIHADARQGTRREADPVKTPVGPPQKTPQGSVTRAHGGGLSATGETQVASYPAPPLPLTQQERLLLRLAHRHDVESMAVLNPDLRAAESAKAAEQFQNFFGINAREMRNQSE